MDITSIIIALIGLCVLVLTMFGIPYLKSQHSQAEINAMMQWVYIAVKSAEQIYKTAKGVVKKEYVKDFLAKKGYKVDTDEVDKAIESAVLEVHNALKEEVKL